MYNALNPLFLSIQFALDYLRTILPCPFRSSELRLVLVLVRDRVSAKNLRYFLK